MNFFALFFFLLVAMVSALPLEMLRYRRQAYYQPSGWGYNTQGRNSLWRFGGVGGPSGEGSTWEGASAFGISNNDISIFGR